VETKLLKVVKKRRELASQQDESNWKRVVLYEGDDLVLAKAIFLNSKKQHIEHVDGPPCASLELEIQYPDQKMRETVKEWPKWLLN
jgi:hypothetical protein